MVGTGASGPRYRGAIDDDPAASCRPASRPLGRARPALERRVLTSDAVRGVVLRPGVVYGRSGSLTGMWFQGAVEGDLRVFGDGANHWATVWSRTWELYRNRPAGAGGLAGRHGASRRRRLRVRRAGERGGHEATGGGVAPGRGTTSPRPIGGPGQSRRAMVVLPFRRRGAGPRHHLCQSHIMIVESAPALTRRLPSGLKATLFTQ